MQFLQKINGLRPHLIRASWAIAELAVSPLLFLVLTPFLLQTLGVEQFGLWMLVMAVVGMGQLVSLGAGTATIKHVSADLGASRPEDAVSTIRAAVTVTLLGGVIMCLVTMITSHFIVQMFFSKMGSPELVSKMLVLGTLLLVIQELDNVFACALRGAQRFDLSAKVEFFTRPVWALGVAMLAWHFHTVDALLLGALFLSCVKVCVKAYQVNRLFYVGDCAKPSFDRSYIRRVTDFGKWQWVQSLGGVLLSVADRLLVGSIFGAEDLARYSICLQLAQYVHIIPAASLQVIFPWLSGKVGRNESIKQLFLYRTAGFGGLLCFIPALIMLPLSSILLETWLGKEFSVGNIKLELVLVLSYGVLAFNVPTHYFLMGLGKIKFVSVSNLIAGVVSVSAALMLAPYGLVWFAAAKFLFGPITLVNLYKLKRL